MIRMTIAGFDEDGVKEVLRRNLTPSESIKSRERLFGRDRSLTTIDRALSSPGRQVFIFGDRGIGKTSLALTAAHLHTSSEHAPIHVNCGAFTDFGDVVQAIGHAVIPVMDRMERVANSGARQVSVLGVGGSYTPSGATTYSVPVPKTINEALDVVRYVAEKSGGKSRVVVIDEIERIKAPDQKERLAEFIKNVAEVDTGLKFIFCGIGSDVSELLGAHPSAGRVLETIELKRLHHDFLWKIIMTPADQLGVKVDLERLIRISQISDGFPHYVHLIGESLFWTLHDDTEEVSAVTYTHYERAMRLALERAEAPLRHQFDKATKKTKNTEDYEEALWSLADVTSDRRQLNSIYEQSYQRIMLKRTGRDAIPRKKLNQRLLSLKQESHGRIVMGYGSGWFGFRENIMRGYVRLDAENKGVALGLE